jgi:hypothetical protein
MTEPERTWTAEEVRSASESLRQSIGQYPRQADMLDAFAERLEDDERRRAIAQNLLARFSDSVEALRCFVHEAELPEAPHD